jgi:hypothetical protein
MRSWALKDGVTISNEDLKSLHDAAITSGESDALKSLLSMLKDEVAAAL